MSWHSHFSITRYPASLRALVSSLVLPWVIFVFLSVKHLRHPCHQHPWYWKTVTDFEAYPSTGGSQYSPLDPMPAHGVLNMYAQLLARFLKPAYCQLRSLALVVKRSLIHSLWGFNLLIWAGNNCSSLRAYFDVSLKVASFYKAALAIIAHIGFCQFCNVFD